MISLTVKGTMNNMEHAKGKKANSFLYLSLIESHGHIEKSHALTKMYCWF